MNRKDYTKKRADCGEIVCKLPRNYHEAFLLSPDNFCYRENRAEHNLLYIIKNVKENKIIHELSIINFIKNGDENYISIGSKITKDHHVIVCDFWKIDQLMLINLKNMTKICISTSNVKPTWEQLKNDYEDKNKIYYHAVATTKLEIYALYKGKPNNFEIHCFSQTGDFLKKLILKEKLISFDITDSYIYGITTDEEIYRYKI